jgi:hypothetical protein
LVGKVEGGFTSFQSGIEDGDDVVYAAHAAAMAEFLGRGEAPGNFPGWGVRGEDCGGWV